MCFHRVQLWAAGTCLLVYRFRALFVSGVRVEPVFVFVVVSSSQDETYCLALPAPSSSRLQRGACVRAS
eukprot:5283276-Alexandrium_andersonii.AAC.1